MKSIPLSILAALAATSLQVAAQKPATPPPAPTVQPQAAQPVQPTVRPPRPRQPQQAHMPAAFGEEASFQGNMKLTLQGNLFGVVPTDFSMLSAGSSFSTDLPVKMDVEVPTIGTLEGTLTPGSPWTVQIILSARVPMKTGAGHYEYRDFRFRTSARVASGKKVTLWEKDGQKLVLGLEEEVPE